MAPLFSSSRIPYSASKFAVRGMMEALYIELRQVKQHHLILSPHVAQDIETQHKAQKFIKNPIVDPSWQSGASYAGQSVHCGNRSNS